LIAGCQERIVSSAATVLKSERDARRISQFGDGGRARAEDKGISNLRELALRALRDRLCGVLLTLRSEKSLSVVERKAAFCPRPVKL